MRKCDVRTIEQAFAYIADCNLATVCDMACKKSRRKGEFARQIAIAQTMVDWMRDFNVSANGTRVEGVLKHGSVEKWANQWVENGR